MSPVVGLSAPSVFIHTVFLRSKNINNSKRKKNLLWRVNPPGRDAHEVADRPVFRWLLQGTFIYCWFWWPSLNNTLQQHLPCEESWSGLCMNLLWKRVKNTCNLFLMLHFVKWSVCCVHSNQVLCLFNNFNLTNCKTRHSVTALHYLRSAQWAI